MLGVGGSTVAGEPPIDRRGTLRGDTCHIDVIDRLGNMVAATPSGGWFQSSPVVPGLGFGLSTRAQMFWLDKGLPNTIAPNKRPRTTLTPSMALKDKRPWLAWGDARRRPAGPVVAHLLLALLAPQAQPCKRRSTRRGSTPSTGRARSGRARRGRTRSSSRGGCRKRRSADLKRRGHAVEVGGDWSEGRLSACAQETRDGRRCLSAAANPRGMQGYAAGR